MSRPPPVPQFVLRGCGAPVNTLHFSCRDPGRPLLFSGSANGCVQVWSLTTRRAERVMEGHTGASVLWLQTLGSPHVLVSQGRDMHVCLWDLSEGRSEVTDSLLTGSVGFCQGSLLDLHTGHWLLALPGADTTEVKVIDLPSKVPVCTLKPDTKLGMLMCVKLWQVRCSTAQPKASERRLLGRLAAHSEPVMCLDFDPGKLRGVSGSSEKAVSSWTLDGQQSLQLQGSVELVNPGISQLSLRHDCKILAAAGWDHRIRIFGWKKLRPLAVLQYHTDSVHCVTFSDHRDTSKGLMAAGSKDQRISIWSLYNQSCPSV
ncbi:GNB1L protein, partial [Amia calva]|nr:GNB1L protein [Amia calva]